MDDIDPNGPTGAQIHGDAYRTEEAYAPPRTRPPIINNIDPAPPGSPITHCKHGTFLRDDICLTCWDEDGIGEAYRQQGDERTLARIIEWLRDPNGYQPGAPRSESRAIPCDHGQYGWDDCGACEAHNIADDLEQRLHRSV